MVMIRKAGLQDLSEVRQSKNEKQEISEKKKKNEKQSKSKN